MGKAISQLFSGVNINVRPYVVAMDATRALKFLRPRRFGDDGSVPTGCFIQSIRKCADTVHSGTNIVEFFAHEYQATLIERVSGLEKFTQDNPDFPMYYGGGGVWINICQKENKSTSWPTLLLLITVKLLDLALESIKS